MVMRSSGVVLVLALAACNATPVDPVARARAAIAEICGAELAGDGCPRMVRHGAWAGRGKLALDPRGGIARLELDLAGPAGEVDDLRQRALDAAGPMLDPDQRRVAAEAIERVFFEDDFHATETKRVVAGDAIIVPYTELDAERPWDRRVILRVWRLRGRPAAVATVPPATDVHSPYGVVDDATVEAWHALCADDAILTPLLGFTPRAPAPEPESTVPRERWNLGDVWLRCYVSPQLGTLAIIDATWSPISRRLVYFRAVVDHGPRGADALVDLVEHTVAPLLTAEQHVRARAAARSPVPYEIGGQDDGAISSMHIGETHEITIRR